MNHTIGENPVLKVAGERLFLGAGSETYEFIKNENGEFYQMVQCSSILGKMIDADMLIDDATMKERACIITDTSVYSVLENTTTVVNSLTDGNDYICCSTTEDGRFMLVSTGEAGNVTTKYTPEELSVPFKIKNIVCKNNVYIATTDEAILKSTDAINWVSVQENVKAQKGGFTKIAYGNNTFVVLCGRYCYISTDNGSTWTQKFTGGKPIDIIYTDGEFLVFHSGYQTEALNATTFEWEIRDISYRNNIIYVDGELYSTIESAQKVSHLTTTNSWGSAIYSGIEGDSNYCLKEANGRVFLGTNKATYELKKNGYYFFTELKPVLGLYGNMIDVCSLDGEIYILTEKGLHKETELVAAPVGDSAKFCCVKGDKISIFSDDGIALSLYQYTKDETMPDFGITDTAYGNDAFIATAGDKILKSTDGIRWRVIKNVDSGDTVNKIIFGNNVFIAFGTAHYYLSTDCGKNWIKSSRSIHFTDAAFDGTDFLLVGHSESKVRINSETFAETVFESDIPLYTVTYAYGSFYAMNDVAQSDGKYYLYKLVGNTWTNIRECDPPYTGGCTIRGTENHLYFSIDNKTYEVFFNQNEAEEVSYEEVSEIEGGIIDACEVMISNEPEPAMVYALSSDESNSKVFILTKNAVNGSYDYNVYEDKQLIDSSPRASYGFNRDSNGSVSNGTSNSYLYESFIANLNKFPGTEFTDTTATYTVITDTHGTPWGSRKAVFDLGDNTKSQGGDTSSFKYYEPVEDTSVYTEMTLLGNHDVAHNANTSDGNIRKGIQKFVDARHNMIFFGLDSADSHHYFSIDINDIISIGNMLQTTYLGWNVAILTHVPLFSKGIGMEDAWTETRPNNARILLDLLDAYQNSDKFTITEDSGYPHNYDFSNNKNNGKQEKGYVVGCFCGHIHRGIQIGRTATYDLQNGVSLADAPPYNIYMESFVCNGEETWIKNNGESDENSSWYHPEIQRIKIDFDKKTVNGHTYDCEKSDNKHNINKTKTLPSDYYKNKAKGFLLMQSDWYPKFYLPKSGDKNHTLKGTYMGCSHGADVIPENSTLSQPRGGGNWIVSSGEIEINGNKKVATHIRFGADGRLRFYCNNGGETEISNYKNANISFITNNVRWNFKGGLYQWDEAKDYTFRKPGYFGEELSYPIFDTDGRYIGWSDTPSGYMTGGRDSSEDSRKWYLGKGKASLKINGENKDKARFVIFGTDGKLKEFIMEDYSRINVPSQGEVIFKTDVNIEWEFLNGLLNSVKILDLNYHPLTIDNEWMDFTNTAYNFTFINGYLTAYTTVNNADTPLHNIAGEWQCHKEVKYYSSMHDMFYNFPHLYSETISALNFQEDSGNKFYISNFNTSYSYAKIETNDNVYYFKNENGKWLMIDF